MISPLAALSGLALFAAGAVANERYTMWKAQEETFCPTCLARVDDGGLRLTSFPEEDHE